MRTRLERRVTARFTWDRLKVSFWFAPLVMSLAAILLARAIYWIDSHIPNEALQNSPLVLSGGVVELRGFLFTMATTILATAGVVFTLLSLPLSTVAAQFGSRLLRVFLGARTTQFVLGMFVGTFVYCITAAATLPATRADPEGPQITATVGLLLLMATLASLILLIQHISTMLQAPHIAAAAGAELLDVVRAEVPREVVGADGQGQLGREEPDSLIEMEGYGIRVKETGYIQYIDPVSLLTLAKERDLIVRLLRKPGHFVEGGAVAALGWPASRVDEQLEERIHHAFRIGNQRTPTQDVEYAVNQLVEMAVRAMSPAINDPFTAMTCLDYIGNGLALFIRQGEKSSYCYDQDGQLRLILVPVTFAGLLDAAFNMLRHASRDNATVLLHMLRVIASIGQETKVPEARQKLFHHACLIKAESLNGTLIEPDRQSIDLSVEALRTTLLGSP